MDIKAKLVLYEFMELGEGPCWDENEQALYWIDTDLKRVHKYCPYEGNKEEYQLEQKIGAVVKENAETLICAMENGFYRISQRDGSQEFLCDPEADKPDNLFNDGKCDKYGRFWAGTMNHNEVENQGTLYTFTSDNKCDLKLKNVTISNGIAWTEDYKTMYYIDSATYRVEAFDYDIEHAAIRNKRIVIEFEPELGMPDGMTIDEDGNLWIAMWGGACVLHCDPVKGEIIKKIELPATNVTSCTFGGKNLDILYITTARAELSEAERKDQPYAGGLFQAKVGTKGFPSNRFGKKVID